MRTADDPFYPLPPHVCSTHLAAGIAGLREDSQCSWATQEVSTQEGFGVRGAPPGVPAPRPLAPPASGAPDRRHGLAPP